MDLETIKWYIIGLALCGNVVLAWRIGSTQRNRWLLLGLYCVVLVGVGGLGLIIGTGITQLLNPKFVNHVHQWFPIVVSGLWCLIILLVLWRIRSLNH